MVVVYFDKEQMVAPKGGENNGQQIAYMHAVSDVETVGMWDGKVMSVVLPSNVLDKAGRRGLCGSPAVVDAFGDPAAIIGATVLTIGSDG